MMVPLMRYSVVCFLTVVHANSPGGGEQACRVESGSACVGERRQRGDHGMAFVQLRGDVSKVSAALLRRASTGAVVSTEVTAAEIAVQIRNHLAVPTNLAMALASGMHAVQGSLPFFVSKPPQIHQGFDHLGTGLFNAIKVMLSTNQTESEQFMAFASAWEEAVETLPDIVESFGEHLEAYREEGDTSALLGVFRTAVVEMGTLVARFLPSQVGIEVTKYLGALEDTLGGFDRAMDAFAAGNTTGAVQAMYVGLRQASEDLIPAALRNDTTFGAIVDSMDFVFRDLSKTVLQYQQHILQSKVCWKEYMNRESIRPDMCPPNHYWDGERWCFGIREGGAKPLQIKNRHGICLDASQRDSRGGNVVMWHCDRKNPNQQWVFTASTGQIKNLHGYCLDASQRSTSGGRVLMWPCDEENKNQQWIYSESTGQIRNRHGICLDAEQFSAADGRVQMYSCDSSANNQQWDMTEEPAQVSLLDASTARKQAGGAVPAHCDVNSAFAEQSGSWCYRRCPNGTVSAGQFCKSACEGAYPVDSRFMCGSSPGTVAAAVQEMVTRALRTGLTVSAVLASSGQAGAMQSTVASLIDLGTGFAHPKCSQEASD